MQTIILVVLSFLLLYLPLDFGGHSNRAEFLLITLVFLLFAGFLLNKKDKTCQNLRGILPPVLMFFLAIIVSLFYSTAFYAGLIEILLFMSYLFAFILTASAYKDRYCGKFTVILAFSVIIVALLGLYFYKITNLMGFESDVYSTFYQKNICAGFFVLTLPVILSLFLTQKNKVMYLYFGLASYLGLLGLLFTQSRWSWLVFAPIFLFTLFMGYKNSGSKKLFVKKSIVLFALFLLSIQIFSFKPGQQDKTIPPFVKERASTIMQIGDSSKAARLEFYLISLKMFKDHPLTGVGPGNFGLYYPKYEKDPRFYSKFVHNFYLQVLCEYGIFGFVIFAVILFLVIKEYLKALKLSKSTKYFPLIWGLVAGCVGVLLHIMVHLDWLFSAPPFYFWVFTGIIFYYSNFLQNDVDKLGTDTNGKNGDSYHFSEKNGSCPHLLPANLSYITAIILVLIFLIVLLFYFADNFAETAKYYRNKGEVSPAVDYYKKAVKLNPLNPDYHKELAALYFYENRSGKACLATTINLNDSLEEAKIAVNIDKLKPGNYILLAKLYKEQGNDKLYIETLERALRVDPINYPSIYNDLAIYYLEKNDLKKTREYVLKIIPVYKDEYFAVMTTVRRPDMEKQLSDSYVLLASADSMEGNNSSAKKNLMKALNLYNDNFSANFALGMICYNNGEYSKALMYLEKSAKLDPSIKQVNDIIIKCKKRIN